LFFFCFLFFFGFVFFWFFFFFFFFLQITMKALACAIVLWMWKFWDQYRTIFLLACKIDHSSGDRIETKNYFWCDSIFHTIFFRTISSLGDQKQRWLIVSMFISWAIYFGKFCQVFHNCNKRFCETPLQFTHLV
jgi:hypothetical protein